MSPSPRPSTVLGLAVCALILTSPAHSSADPVSRSVDGTDVFGAIPAGARIDALSTTVDQETGEWSARIRFDAAVTAQNASELDVILVPQDRDRPSASWSLYTDPATVVPPARPAPEFVATSYASGPAPARTAVAYDADHTVLTLSATDPSLAGSVPDDVIAETKEPRGGTTYSRAEAFLGPTAPQPTLTRAGRSLVTNATGLITIPLTPLRTPAAQRVTISMPGLFAVGVKTLPAKDYRRRSITIRVRREELRTTPLPATLARTAWLGNGSTSSTSRTVTIRRR